MTPSFLAEVGKLVVKPARGEQGQGITVGVSDAAGLARAVELARSYCPDVLLEEFVAGEDLRVLVDRPPGGGRGGPQAGGDHRHRRAHHPRA